MGNDSSPDLRQAIANNNYNYGEVMAQKGFVTYAIDWIGFGERNDRNKPNHNSVAGGRDWCNLYYLHATMLGMTSLSINVAHGKVATDVAISTEPVDEERLGVMGLSGGGTMALWMALCDERFKAAEIICYSDLWARLRHPRCQLLRDAGRAQSLQICRSSGRAGIDCSQTPSNRHRRQRHLLQN